MAELQKQQSNDYRSAGSLRLALPSDGEMFEPTQRYLALCGMPIDRPSPRRYTASMPAVANLEVIFQRTADITAKIEDGNADLGIVGFDRFAEGRLDGGDTILIIPGLGFGRCELVVAVPDAWLDVESLADLATVAIDFRESGRELRVATKYPRLVSRFFFSHGINYFALAAVSGTLEAAIAMGYADIIVDITASGVTLRENRLKRLNDGQVLISEGALVGNKRLLKEYPARLRTARDLIERIEAHRNASLYQRITANITGESEESVAAMILQRPEYAGLQGPTVSRVFSADGRIWFSITVYVGQEDLMETVNFLRSIGGVSVTVSRADYVFGHSSEIFANLLTELGSG